MRHLFLIMVLLTASVFAQDAIKLDGHKFIGRTNSIAFAIDFKNAIRTGDNVSFNILGAYYQISPQDQVMLLDKNNYQIFMYAANCRSYEFMHVRSQGKRSGLPFDLKEALILERATVDHPMREVIEDICGLTLVRRLIA